MLQPGRVPAVRLSFPCFLDAGDGISPMNDGGGDTQAYRFGPYRLDAAERRLYRDMSLVPLTRKVFDLLLVLVQSPGRLKTREELITALWSDRVVEEQNLTTKVYALRKALGDLEENPRYLETVRGVGYRFIAPVKEEDASTGSTAVESAEMLQRLPAGRPRRLVVLAAMLTTIAAAGVAASWLAVPKPLVARPAQPTIAVLPFENLSTEPGNAYFAAGIQDTILTRLAGVPGLRVISRTSSNAYSTHPENLRSVANELHANLVLEGSVQRIGDSALINVQLIDANTDSHLWAQTYTQALDSIFDAEGHVAADVAKTLETNLPPSETVQLSLAPTQDAQAYLLFLKANYFAFQVIDRRNSSRPDIAFKQAIALYSQALHRDPHFALAYARLSLLETFAYWWRIDITPEHLVEAENSAKQAISFDSRLLQAHMALGYVQYYIHRDYSLALSEFQRALQMQPDNTEAISAIAFIQRRQGKWRQSLAGLLRSMQLDPRNPHWPDEAGITALALRDYPQAEQLFEQTLAIEPGNYDVRIRECTLSVATGNLDRASQILTQMRRDEDPLGLVSAYQFFVFMLSRKPDQALAALNSAPAWVSDGNSLYLVPKTLPQAEAWALKGESSRARHLYADARNKLRTAIREKPDNPMLWGELALAEVGYGDKAAAIRAGTKAIQLLPVSKDAYDGPALLETLATIYAKAHEPERAVALLKQLLALPTGGRISVPLLQLNPVWDPIRTDPGFQTLLKQPLQAASIHAAKV